MKTTIKIEVPKQMEILCQIMETTPQDVIQEFVNNLSHNYKGTSGSDERMMAMEYFIRVGYGMHIFTIEDTQDLFSCFDALRHDYSRYGSELEWLYQKEIQRRCKKLVAEFEQLKVERKKGLS